MQDDVIADAAGMRSLLRRALLPALEPSRSGDHGSPKRTLTLMTAEGVIAGKALWLLLLHQRAPHPRSWRSAIPGPPKNRGLL